MAVLLCGCGHRAERTIPPGAIPIVYTDYIFVQGLVDSVPCNILLDTGADNLYLDSVFYAASGLYYPRTHLQRVRGIGNSYQNILIIGDSLDFRFYGRRYRTSDVVVLMLKPVGGDFVDGLLGTSYFMQNLLLIDYVNGYVQNYPSLDSVDLEGFVRVPLNEHPYGFTTPVSIRVNDTLTLCGECLVDIGMPGTTLSSAEVARFNLERIIERKARYYSKYAGIGGESWGYDFVPDTVRMGDFCFMHPTVSFSIDSAGVLAEDGLMGVLGGNLLSRFDLLFDFVDTALYLRPNAHFAQPFVYDRMGFSYTDRYATKGGWVVASITYGSQADLHGLRCDDLIVAVNGKPVSEIPYLEQAPLFESLRRVDFTVRRSDTTLNIQFDLVSLL